MKTTANAALCCDIYDKLGWELPLKEMDLWVIGKGQKGLCLISNGSWDLNQFVRFVPAYDSDFLLQKLPKFVVYENYRYDLQLHMSSLSNDWFAWYVKGDENTSAYGIAKNPADALADLALKLHKAGELKGEPVK